MRSVQVCAPGSIAALRVRELPAPVPRPDEVLIEFEASAINPADVLIRRGSVRPLAGSAPFTLGYDLVGRVIDQGKACRTSWIGSRVLAMSAMALTGRGTWADLVCLPESSVCRGTESTDGAVLAQLPLAGLTAYQAVRRLDVPAASRVLVAGAAGAVGQFVVQLLVRAGVEVLAMVRRTDQLARLPVHDQVEGCVGLVDPQVVDGAIDAAGIDVTAAVRPGGSYVSLVPHATPSPAVLAAGRVRHSIVITQESGADLAVLTALVASGALTLQQVRSFHLDDIHAAHEEFERGTGRRTTLVR